MTPSEHPGSEAGSSNAGRPWRLFALGVAGGAVIIAGTVVATLAATHRTAVLENAKAYANGLHDARWAAELDYDCCEL